MAQTEAISPEIWDFASQLSWKAWKRLAAGQQHSNLYRGSLASGYPSCLVKTRFVHCQTSPETRGVSTTWLPDVFSEWRLGRLRTASEAFKRCVSGYKVGKEKETGHTSWGKRSERHLLNDM